MLRYGAGGGAIAADQSPFAILLGPKLYAGAFLVYCVGVLRVSGVIVADFFYLLVVIALLRVRFCAVAGLG